MMCSRGWAQLKEPNVAGQFYPADSAELERMMESFFAVVPQSPADPKIKMIIAPHAGYVYSGQIAAFSYKAIADQSPKTIVLLGPSHFFDYEGVSVWKEGGFKTPLGTIPVDSELSAAITSADPAFVVRPDVFEREHSLEVQMPFLQKIYQNFKIVPILMGRPSYKVCEKLAETLERLIGSRDDVLLVVSTDMSHYHKAPVAEVMDSRTLQYIRNTNPKEVWNQCLIGQSELCGFTSVITGLIFAERAKLKDVKVLRYAHSGMVSGDNNRVVGYTSVVFSSQERNSAANSAQSLEKKAADQGNPDALTAPQKKHLIKIAKDTIGHYLDTGKTLLVEEKDPRLQKTEGAFVTIHKHGQLRGCIGTIIGNQPLYLTVRDMAIAAASQDPRFPPVTKEEWPELDIEISVLSVPWRIKNVDEIEMGVHGVIIGQGDRRGLFLPQVATDTGWSREEFLSQLCHQKAGLPADCWKNPAIEIHVFTADVFDEKDLL